MSQNNQRKHYHIHAPYQHPQQQQQQQAQHHHPHHLSTATQHLHHQQQQQQQQWYSQQQHYQHGLHLRDSRHISHAAQHHHQQQQQQPQQHSHHPHHSHALSASHMYPSGYVGMSSATTAAAGSASASSSVSHPGSSHNMPVPASSSSSSVHHHYSASALATSSVNNPASVAAAAAAGPSGSSYAAAAAAASTRSRMYDLDMLTPQQQQQQQQHSQHTAHSMLSSNSSTGRSSGFDVYSHNSLYAQQQQQQSQRHHSASSSSSHHPHHMAATHHSLHSSHHHTPHHSQQQHHQQQHQSSSATSLHHQHHGTHQQTQPSSSSSHSLHHHHQQQQQHYYHHHQHHHTPQQTATSLHRSHNTQVMGPMLQHIKSEPVEQITVTPSIQTEEVIIKSEPVDDSGYHKSAPQIENNTFHMEEKRKQQQQHEYQQQKQQLLQQQQQQQQQKQQQQLHEQQQQRVQQQKLHEQQQQKQQQQQELQQQIQIKQEPHDYPQNHHQQHHPHHQEELNQQSEYTHNEVLTQQTQKSLNSENSTTIEKTEQKPEQTQQQTSPASATAAAAAAEQQQSQQISLTNIKTEAKPLNFPRRKLQTERSSTLPICQRCKQVFLKRQNYTQHVALSSCNIVEYDFKCSVCPMSFMSNEELQTHEQLHRSHRYFCQKYCGKFYETIEECEQHEYGQHEYEMYKCNICCISVTQRDQLFAHLQEHKYQPRFDCCICRLCFQTSLELHDHYMANEDFCGKFYDKEAFKKPITSLTTPYLGKPESSNLEISHTFSLKDIPPASSQHLEPLYTKPTTSKTSMEPPNTTTSSKLFSLDPPEFALEPQVEVKTEIKVEPDFYPPMDQSEYPNYDQDYNTNDYNSRASSNQSLSFLHDYQDNASSSTNSSFSFNNNNDAIQEEDAMCCVPKCGVSKYSAPSLQFFGFPRDEKYLSQWLHNLKMIYDPNVNYGAYRICSLHFPKRCIAKYSLSYWAVPTFNLGHDDVGNLYQNRESSGGFPGGEMAKCSMPGCPSQRGETNVKFHVFPRDLKTLIKWCQNSRLPVHSKDNRFFCSRHFEEKCFGKFRLKPWAIPTLNLGTVYGKIHDNPNIYQEEKKCFLPFCRRSRSYDCNLSLYRFPRDETLLRRWCYNLRLDPNMYRGKNHKICSSHFIKEALGLRKLNPGAVPTLNLGHNDRFNIYENELYTPPPPPPPPPQHHASTSSKAHKFERMFKQEMGSGSRIYDNVFMGSMVQKYSSSSSSSNSGNNLDLGDVCLVPTCKRTRHSADITLHTVPKRPEQLKKWCHNLKMNLEKMHKSVRICSAHFEKYCIGGCMRPFAVPTLELGHDDPNIYRNPDVIKKLNIRETCCVQSCKRNRDRDHANLHRFPTHPELLQKWCENLQKPIPDGSKLFNDAVCEIHFEERCLRNKRLEKWAIPTLNLGWDGAPHSLPSEEEINENWVKPFAPNNGDEQGECCVASCKRNPQIDDVKLYRPPEDAEQLNKWAHNLQVDVAELPNLKICNLHFEQHCIGKRLLNWAMPTLNLGAKVEHLFENPPPMPAVYKKKLKPERILSSQEGIKWSPRCCLPHCRKMRSADNVHLFRFPYNNRQTLAKWCHNLQLPLVGSSHRRICSTHFESSVLTKRCPMSLAVPTLDLNAPPGYKIYQNPARLKQIKPGAQRQCIIESCRKTKLDGVTLYRFPNNRSILYKWRHNIKNWPKGKLSSQLRICGEHFEPHSVSEKKLSPGAIPTLNLGHDSKDLYPNETRSFFDLEKCVVNGCDSRKEMEDIRLFRFPRDDEELLKKWCHNLQMNPNDCVGIKICSKHFDLECLGPRQLYKWAIPTLKLGHKEDDLVDIIPNPPPEQRTGEFLFKCCVPTCGKTRKYDDAQMNSFPKNLKLFRKWKHNLKLDFLNFKERDKYKICNDHFEPICVGKTRLNFGALPTLNLGHDDVEDLYQINPDRIRPNLFIKQKDVERLERRRILREENQEEEQPEEYEGGEDQLEENVDPLSLEATDIKCCIEECCAPKSIMREPYDLPESREFKQLWLKEIKSQDEDDFLLEQKICGLHFQALFEKLKDKMQSLSDNNEDLRTDFNKLLFNYQKSTISLVINSYQCRVENCPSNLLNPSMRLFFFPYGKTLINKWSHNTGIIPDEHRRYMNKVCALHFESYCITENQRLRSWAIPTLNLPFNDSDKTFYKNPDLTKLDRRMLGPQILKCAVSNCRSAKSCEEESVKLFNFPTEDKLLKKWCDNLKISHNLTPLLKVCSRHFEKLCFGSCRIRSWAIPTLNLGHDQPPEHLNKFTINKEVYQAPEENSDIQLKQVKIKRSLDSAKCSIASCRKSRLKHGVRFYTLPSNPKMKRKWLHNLQIKHLKSSSKISQIKICNLHFHKRCLEGKQLKPWAVPTMHLGHSEHIFDNPRRVQSLPVLRCALSHCKNHASLKGVRAFVFPRSMEYLEKWSKNLKLDIDKCKGRLCQEHFEKEVIGNRKLKKGAVPTLNLGHEDEDIYDNSELKEKLCSKQIEEVKICPDYEIEYEQHSDEDEEEEEEEIWESELEDEEEEEDPEQQIYYDDEEEEDEEEYEEEDENSTRHREERESERNLEEDNISVSNSISDWSSIKFKELRVSITPLTPEDLMDLCSRSSYEREFGSLTPASSLKGRRSITPASSWKDIRSETPEQKSNAFGLNLKSNSENQEQKSFNDFREPRSVTPDHKIENKTEETNNKSSSTSENLRNSLSNENKLKREHSEANNEEAKRERLELTEDETSSTSLPNETEFGALNTSKTNLRTDKALNAVAPICCLKHCGKEKTPEQHLTTYGFPKDPQLLQKWCDNLGLQPEECIGRVCIDHFELRVIGTRRLKQGAVPTLNLGPNQVAKHTNVEETATKKTPTKEFSETNNLPEVESNLKPPPPYKTPKLGKQSVFRLCCLKHCRRKKFVKPEKREKEKEKMPIMFRFPEDEKIKKKWFKNLRLPENLELKQDLEICSRHFEREVIRNNKLLPGAVPTLELSYANRKPIYKNCIKEVKIKEHQEEKREEQELIKKELKMKQKTEKCFLKHCGKQEKENVFLIAFPLNEPVTLRKWCKNLKLNYEKKSYKNYKICNEHFEAYVFYKKRHLRTGALPTLNLGHSDVIIRNCRRLRLKRSNSLKLKEICCLKQCQSSNHKLYTFPRNSELRKIWCNNLQLELRQVLNNHLKICKQHFPHESFIVGTDNLKLNAIPVLNLGLQTEQHVVKLASVEERKCLVENCQKTPSVDRVKLFGFPDNPEILKKWFFNLNLSPETFKGNELICSKHFDKTSIKNGQLHENAIPTQFLELSEKSWFYNNTSELYECQKQCCVLNCKQGADQAKHLYRFPKHKEDVDKWLYNLKLPLDETEVKDLRVCDRHFEQSCKISHKDLITQALPTLNLGHNDTDIYGNNFIKCCLDLCSIEGFYYHKLPEDLMLQSFWFQELEMESSFNNSSYICSVHFVAFFERILEKYSVFLKESKEYVKLSVTYNELKALPALQTYKCHIPKCNSGFKLIWKLFKFPKDHNLFNKWLHNTGLQFDYSQRPLYRLCAQHFEERCLSEKKLHRWSLPTLNLPFNNSLYVNPPEALPPQHENLKHCCVANCVNLKGPFYKFPAKQLDIKKWVHNLELGPQQCTLNLRVCIKHFENYCFAKAKDHIKPLKSWSVPTLKLKRKTDLFLNPPDKIDFYVCCLASCKQRLNKSKDIHLFKFPLSNSLKQKWLHNLNIPREDYKESMRLCSLHFEMDCFYKGFKLLRKHSVPTLGLGANPPPNLYTNPPRRLYLKCCVKVCKNPGQDLLAFPKQKIVLRKWCHNLQLAKEIKCESLRDWKICKRHFENECFNRLGRLRNMAVPTLKLGHRRKIFQNPDFSLKTGSKTSKEKEVVETNNSNIINKQTEEEEENSLVKTSVKPLKQEQEVLNPPNDIENTSKTKTKVKNIKSGNAVKECQEPGDEIPNSEDISKSPEKDINETTPELQNAKQETISTKSNISRSQSAGRKVKDSENSEECNLLETKISRSQSEGRKVQERKKSGNMVKGLTKESKVSGTKISRPRSIGRKAQQQENSENSKKSGDSPEEPENAKNEFEVKLQEPQNPENLQTDKSNKQETDSANNNSENQKQVNKQNKETQNLGKPLKRRQPKKLTDVKRVKSRNVIRRPKATPKHNNNLGSPQETNDQQDQENQDLSGLDEDIALSEVKAKLKAKTLKLRRMKKKSLKLKRITKISKPKAIKDKITEPKTNLNPPPKTNTLEPLQETFKTEKPENPLNFSIRDLGNTKDSEALESTTVEDLKTQPEKRTEDLYLENLLDILTESQEDDKHQPEEIIKSETTQHKSQGNSENLLQIIRETQDLNGEGLYETSTEQNTCFTIYEIKQEVCEEAEDHQENNYKKELSDFKTPDVREQKEPTNEDKDKLMENEIFISCSVTTCPNFNNPESKVPLFKLPTLGKLRNQWLENCKLKQYASPGVLLQLKICLEHFEKQCFMCPQRLLLGAVPTLKLGRKLTGKHFLEYYRNLRCSVVSCQRSKLYDKVQSIKFPEGELKRKWCCKLGLKEEYISEDSWICHKHFERTSLIEGRKAKEGVIPSLLLTKEEELAGEQRKFIKCCVRSCGDELKPPCFKFPYHNPEIYGKWLRQLKLKDSAFTRTKAYVCSKHFNKQSFQMQNKHLKPKAIPELYLEDQEGGDYEQENAKFKCCYPSCQVESENLYNWPNKGLFAQLNKKSLNFAITPTKSDFLKLCCQHFYIFYKSHEDLINSHKSSKTVEDLKQKTKETLEQLLQLPQIYGFKCAVKSCKTDHNLKANKSVKLFPFPDNELAHKWCHNIELNYATLRQKPELKVCELHFIHYCIYRRNLWPWAIPTLNLTLPEKDVIQNDNQEVTRLMGLCCIASCINNKELTSNPNFRFYKFPQDSEMLKKWLDITQCKKFKRNFTRICGLHFNRSDFNKNLTLKTTALPRLNLDNEEAEGLDENIQVKQELDNYEEWPEPDCEDFEKDCKESDHVEGFENAYSICDIQDDIQIKQELDISDEWPQQDTPTNVDFMNQETDFQIKIKQEIFEEPNDVDLNLPNEQTDSNPPLPPSLSNLIITDIKSQIYLCCVQKCPNNSQTPNIQMFNEFPRDSEIFIKWCFNLKIDPRLYQENQYAICQQHFENICFDSDNSLHPWAVPTLHLNLNENSFIHENDIPEHMKPASEQCLVYGCINPLKPLYKFPFKPDLSHKWFANLKLDYTDFRAQNYRICKRHFPQIAFEANDLNKLKSEAVPSLFLGHNDKILYFNTMEDQMAAQQQQQQQQQQQEQAEIIVNNQDNSRGSSQASLRRIISPHLDLEDHDSSYFEDFEEYYGQED